MVDVAATSREDANRRRKRRSCLRWLVLFFICAAAVAWMQETGEEHLSIRAVPFISTAENDTAMVEYRTKIRETGAFANCTGPDRTVVETSNSIVSCQTIQFVASKETFQQSGSIMVGVISSANNFKQRQDIRATWAEKGMRQLSPTVVFVVAGLWEDVKVEQEQYGDLIWINMDESFRLITYKTSMLLQVVHQIASELDLEYSHILKTDDDSYVAVNKLKYFIQQQQQQLNDKSRTLRYWGKCRLEFLKPIRNPDSRYYISREEYPEAIYPPYCTGAGILVSRSTVECMTRNMKEARFLAMEDVYLGLLAGRCGIYPTHDLSNYVRKYRVAGHDSIKKDKTAASWLPNATMKGRIIQHEIYNHDDMMAHHEAMQNEIDERFPNTSR